MKKQFVMMAVVLGALTAVCSCEKASVDIAEAETGGVISDLPKKAFTFHVKGDFETNYEEMGTRASMRLENENTAGVTDLWVMDYVGGELVQTVHQVSTDEGFGTVAMALVYGHHDVKFIASKGDAPALTASALAWVKVKDTFILNYPVDVAASSNGNRAPELKRAIGGVKVVATDAVKNGTQKVSVEMKRSLALALPSLEVSEAAVGTNEFAITPGQWGKDGLVLTTYTLCDEELTTDVMVTVTGADDAVISQFTVKDVSVKKNRITTLTGEVFGRGEGFSVMIDDGWDEGVEVKF